MEKAAKSIGISMSLPKTPGSEGAALVHLGSFDARAQERTFVNTCPDHSTYGD